jgi:hypothetical protein
MKKSKNGLYNIPSQMENYSNDDIDSNLMKVRIKFNKTGKNYNWTKFTKEALVDAEPTLKNIPILAYIKCTDEDLDKYDFDGHNTMTKIIETPNGYKVEYKYLERPIGVIPETNNVTYEVGENGEEYCVCDGYVWKSYSNEGYEIIKNSEYKSVSMEIREREGHYDQEDDYYDITKFTYQGITVLGDDVEPAIEGANLTKYSSMDTYKEELQKLYEAIYQYEKGERVLDNQVQEPKVDEPQVDEPKVDDPQVDEPKVDDVEEPEVDEPQVDEPEVDFSKFAKLLNVEEEIKDVEGLYSIVESTLVNYSNSIADLTKEIENNANKQNEMEKELTRLQEFEKQIKANEQKEAIDVVTNKYQTLLESDFSELTAKAESGEMEITEYEKELALLFSREYMENKGKFSKKEENNNVQKLGGAEPNQVNLTYGDVSKYMNK